MLLIPNDFSFCKVFSYDIEIPNALKILHSVDMLADKNMGKASLSLASLYLKETCFVSIVDEPYFLVFPKNWFVLQNLKLDEIPLRIILKF